MASLLQKMAELTEQLLHTSAKVKILDVAAGHGLFGISFARNNLEAEIYALDFCAGLESGSGKRRPSRLVSPLAHLAVRCIGNSARDQL